MWTGSFLVFFLLIPFLEQVSNLLPSCGFGPYHARLMG